MASDSSRRRRTSILACGLAEKEAVMALPATDAAYLTERNIAHAVSEEANMTCVVIPAFALPAGYDQSATRTSPPTCGGSAPRSDLQTVA
jgi:hypothetical protein